MSSGPDEIKESHTDANPSLNDFEQDVSSRNQSVTDIPQLEYDECDIQLIADRGKFFNRLAHHSFLSLSKKSMMKYWIMVRLICLDIPLDSLAY